jgi:hypothetical protein
MDNREKLLEISGHIIDRYGGIMAATVGAKGIVASNLRKMKDKEVDELVEYIRKILG